ncbi:MAG TPA: RdgB/HAM1 family non-canonical purine NTP pyrophosphatase [Segetibacter sp.]
MKKLIFATNNNNKVAEIRSMAGATFEFISLKEAGIDIDIAEPHDTLEANAREKCITIYKLTGEDCLSEDTGLEVQALRGEPGVKSARYAGEKRDDEDNVMKLLEKMDGFDNRNARIRTVIYLLLSGKEYSFEGVCNGTVATVPKGQMGFGYDPVFVPEGCTKTFAEMTLQEKNTLSHRKKAFLKLQNFLSQIG